MSLMTSLSTGVSGLRAAQTAVNTTAHNIANVNTKGYSRQDIINADKVYNKVGSSHISYSQVGLGSEVAAIKQSRNVFYDKAYRLQVGRQNFYEVQSEAVSEIENLMGEMNGVQFQNTVADVWNSVQELAKEPDSIVKRTAFISTANTFLLRAQDIYSQLESYQVNLNTQIQESVDRINQIGEKIKALNTEIARYEIGSENANDYRDQRNLLLDELGEYASISYYEDVDGKVLVNIEGTQFVSQDHVYKIHTEPLNETTRMLNVVWGTGNPVFNLDQGFSSEKNTDIGKLKSLLMARGDAAGKYTDIPSKTDEKYNKNGTFNQEAYDQDVIDYNKTVGSYIIMNNQASFDKLIHAVATAINDVLCPNSDVDSVLGNLGLTTTETEVTYTDYRGKTVKKNLSEVKIWDEYNVAVGMDEDATPREELFSRQAVERYTEVEIEVADKDGNTSKKKIWIYNEEDPKDEYTLYTTKQMNINENLLDNPSKLPLSANNYLGGVDGYDEVTCEKLKEIWNVEFDTINPNVLTKQTFTDYYQALIGNVATLGREYKSMASDQEGLVEGIDSNRQAVSGVSSDEQLTYLIQFQYAYTANSRYITTIDEMLADLLNKLS